MHDPLMHGPFLFHFGALIYLLFGDTDATARYGAAFFGVLMVGMPWLLRGRHFLGKYGALAASFFILISPSILYQSRYIRHDIYTIGGTLFLFICIFRYLETAEASLADPRIGDAGLPLCQSRDRLRHRRYLLRIPLRRA